MKLHYRFPLDLFFVCPQQKLFRVLSNGLGVNVTNQDGFTPLHMAALHGHADLVSLLLKHGANIGQKNADRAVPLHLACQSGHTQVNGVLLRPHRKGTEMWLVPLRLSRWPSIGYRGVWRLSVFDIASV